MWIDESDKCVLQAVLLSLTKPLLACECTGHLLSLPYEMEISRKL
jgi:hypothetical protein